MRILFSHRIGTRDGQSVHIEELVAAFRHLGHGVHTVAPQAYEKAEFGDDSKLMLLIRRHLPRSLAELAELVYNVPALWRLRKAARAFGPDVIYERYNLFFLGGTILARLLLVPLYLEVNAPLADERERFNGLGLKRMARATERYTWRSASRVLTVTQVLKDRVAAGGVPTERIEVTPNGTDLERFVELPRREAGVQPVILGFVGFMRDWHGIDTVIKAMSEYRASPAVRLVIVGEGPARAGLEALAADRGIAHQVQFVGLANRAAIPGLVGGFDIALQPRVVSYASPLKIFEYMAAGRAIVAPDQTNIREILTHGVTALLFDPHEPSAMWTSVRTLLADPGLRHTLGAAARREIQRRDFTWIGNARRISEWMRADLARHGVGGLARATSDK
jgi:glycosyltransferase involved in cell wall biosynthesis